MDTKEKWAAVISNDQRYDGRFFYGVKSTGIYCRPSCKSKNPSQKNVLFFDSREEAEFAGLRPCKICRPDLLSYDPAADMAEAVKDLIDRNFADRIALQDQLNSLGVSRRHLTELFERRFDMPPEQYMNQVRFSHAKSFEKPNNKTGGILPFPGAYRLFIVGRPFYGLRVIPCNLAGHTCKTIFTSAVREWAVCGQRPR
ncbi:methylphosphotriester-DNA--protein-cysteine methyltransferase family protein [Clostridium sp. AM58-1XD]|uniref:methylphosphotriester-DNA--protein-cysteine methyltransferase family protein n=1 Tax=Clostridium sp. AM58-1XD TaxID=2292307 RepID=UPI0015F3668E|nr:methylphosphotriester-DNA--protein-cysteine methyltransferase family protein [Clostridium sp. AM58-1XD]